MTSEAPPRTNDVGPRRGRDRSWMVQAPGYAGTAACKMTATEPVYFVASDRALAMTLSISTGLPPWRLLSSAASMKAKISSVSSALTGGLPVLKNLTISTTSGSYPP